jgi:hypothetical protein
MLESGSHATIAEIAAAEKINASYVGRVLRLTLLAPDIVEAILGGAAAGAGDAGAPDATVSGALVCAEIETSAPRLTATSAGK